MEGGRERKVRGRKRRREAWVVGWKRTCRIRGWTKDAKDRWRREGKRKEEGRGRERMKKNMKNWRMEEGSNREVETDGERKTSG